MRGVGVGFLGLVILGIVFGNSDDAPPLKNIDIPAVSAEFRTLIEGANALCDAPGKELAAQMKAAVDGSGDAYAGYQSAKAVQEACGLAARNVIDIPIPEGLADETRSVFEDARESCQLANLYRARTGEVSARIFDGEGRPSVIAELGEATDAMTSALFLCAGGLEAIAPAE